MCWSIAETHFYVDAYRAVWPRAAKSEQIFGADLPRTGRERTHRGILRPARFAGRTRAGTDSEEPPPNVSWNGSPGTMSSSRVVSITGEVMATEHQSVNWFLAGARLFRMVDMPITCHERAPSSRRPHLRPKCRSHEGAEERRGAPSRTLPGHEVDP